MENELERLMMLVNESLDVLYSAEKYLFENNSSEQNKVFHFARYFIENMKKHDYYNVYDVDCEYNRNCFDEKKYKAVVYEKVKHRILPDFVLHKRGRNNDNVLVVEFKNAKKMTESDYYKLKALTDKDGGYNYKLGLFIKFNKKREDVEIRMFINGMECKKGGILYE